MNFSKTSKISFIACLALCLATSLISKNDKQNQKKELAKTPSLKNNDAIVKYAVGDIKECLSKPEVSLSTVCCTYKFNGTKVVSKEIKTHYNGYRIKPDYHKESFLNESSNHPDKIVQVQFTKHSDKLLVTYKDPNDRGRRIYSESLDASQYSFTEQS